MDVSKILKQDGKEVKLDIEAIVYKDLQDIVRMLGWGIMMEFETDAEGGYVKYGNGFMICFMRNISITGNGSTYIQRSVDFPEPFISVPVVLPVPTTRRVNGSGSTTQFFSAIPSSVSNAEINVLRFMYGDGSPIPNIHELYVDLVAIGRWK